MNFQTLFVGRHLIRLSEVDSTNVELARREDASFLPEGAVLSADFQTAGRGQRERVWSSNSGENVLMSVLLRPKSLSVNDQFTLNKSISLAVRAFVADKVSAPVTIKWPNDIYIEDRKVCGILIENGLKGTGIDRSIVGIGLNLNQMDFPKELASATSLKAESGKFWSPEMAIPELCRLIESFYLKLKSDKKSIEVNYDRHLYRAKSAYLFHLEDCDCEKELRIIGVTNRGELRVTDNLGSESHYPHGEINFV